MGPPFGAIKIALAHTSFVGAWENIAATTNKKDEVRNNIFFITKWFLVGYQM
jgi:hypothetical protein